MMMDPNRFAPWVSGDAQALFRAESCAPAPPAGDIAALRVHYDEFNRRHLAVAREHYAVDVAADVLGGVRVDVVSPAGGARDPRTLISLHGGAFMWGRGAGALLEAVPLAAVTGMRVIAVEYALAPEQIFPAAVDDVLSVYRELCAQQSSASIGMYGCSAGGILTAQTVARLVAERAPLPGAIAMLCGTGLEIHGDSAAVAAAFTRQSGDDVPSLAALPYFASAKADDPLVFPGDHRDVLAHFPPSLLVTGSRDFAASSVTVMHRRLLAAGASASLLHFDGMWHAFHMATTLPEARETFAAMARFFDSNLA
jgi:acetyl esterase/lipase